MNKSNIFVLLHAEFLMPIDGFLEIIPLHIEGVASEG